MPAALLTFLRASFLARPVLRASLTALAVAAAANLQAAPLMVDEAIRLALQNNQQVKVSAFSPQISRANVLAAYGAFDPALTFRRTYSENETPGVLAPLVTRSLTKTD